MKNHLLVTLANEKYLKQAKQLFYSVYKNAGWNYDYMLLSHEINDHDLEWFISKGILVKKCKSLEIPGVKYYYSPVVLDKFYLFTSEFKKWRTITFLDSDIIVKGSLRYLTRTKHFSAVQDLYFNELSTQFFNDKRQVFNDKKYDTNIGAFNSGVFSFRTDLIEDDTFDELVHIFNSNRDEFKYLDQATLNLYFYKKWKELPYIFNVMMPMFDYKIPPKIKCSVLHFITCPGHPSLWDKSNSYFNEWESNCLDSDLFNLNKPLKGKKLFLISIIYYHKVLKDKLLNINTSIKFYNFIKRKISAIRYFFSWAPERVIGTIGMTIRKLSPRLYEILKHGKINQNKSL